MSVEGWKEEIREAQRLVAVQIGVIDYPRISYGAEPRVGDIELPRHCHDCGVHMGQLHVPGCDMEVCPSCRGQLLGCSCDLRVQVYSCGCRLPVDGLEEEWR